MYFYTQQLKQFREEIVRLHATNEKFMHNYLFGFGLFICFSLEEILCRKQLNHFNAQFHQYWWDLHYLYKRFRMVRIFPLLTLVNCKIIVLLKLLNTSISLFPKKWWSSITVFEGRKKIMGLSNTRCCNKNCDLHINSIFLLKQHISKAYLYASETNWPHIILA